ncbi:MAG: hypothetical protein RhofKO_25170 [Rhodothermales bacterium]
MTLAHGIEQVLGVSPTRQRLVFIAAYIVLRIAAGQLASILSTTGGISVWYASAGLDVVMLSVLGLQAWRLFFLVQIGLSFMFIGWELGLLWYSVSAGLKTVAYTGGLWLVVRFGAIQVSLERLRDVLGFIVGGVLLAPLGNAVAQAGLRLARGRATGAELVPDILNFWIGDATGIIMLAPALLVLLRYVPALWHSDAQGPLQPWLRIHSQRDRLVFAVFYAALFAVIAIVFWLPPTPSLNYAPLLFAPIFWAATFKGFERTAVAVFVLNVVTVITVSFYIDVLDLFAFQVSLLIISLAGIIMGSYVTNRQRIKLDLIHARRAAEAAILLQQYLLQNLSHEIRTPLTGILGYAELLELESEGREAAMYQHIQQHGEALLDVLMETLAEAQMGSAGLSDKGEG